MNTDDRLDIPPAANSGLEGTLREISEKCIECKLCVKQCAFLQKYGTPKGIADSWAPPGKNQGNMPFACSLCSLCTAVCPVEIDPREMFLQMRRHLVATGTADLVVQKPLLAFEKWGTSGLFTFYGLPEGCDTVLFPGCALAGSRSSRVLQLYEKLQKLIPALGIVLDCCTKPSHDLGRSDYFHAMFYGMHDYLAEQGIRKVITACPSCHNVFLNYSREIVPRSIYEILAEQTRQPGQSLPEITLTVQDSCVGRFDRNTQAAVRKLIQAQGLTIVEMRHHALKTLCCGEGGGAHFTAPDLAGQWGEIRRQEGEGKIFVTYCAGCANFLGRIGKTAHLLDLVFQPQATLAGRIKVAKSPVTYLKRLLLKNRLRRSGNFTVTSVRNFTFNN